MKRKKFNELSVDGKYKRLRNRAYTFKALKWISILSPYFIIGAVNFEDYFTEYNGVKMSIGCVLALVVAGIAIMNETKENKKVNGLVVWGVVFALVLLMQSILNDLLLIVGFGLLGQLVGAGFEIGTEKEMMKAKVYQEASIRAEAYNEEKKDE